MHQFFVRESGRHRGGRDKPTELYRVFGMTARIIVDAARVAYGEEPEFEHNSHFGDEAMIAKLRRIGRLRAERKASDGLTRATMAKAKLC